MNTQNRWKKVLVLAGLLGLAASLASADAVLHARVSFDAGGTVIRGSEEGDWSHATINTLVLPGDTLWVDKGGTSEIEFSGGSFLRMADGSKAEIATISPDPTVRGWVGSIYVQRLSRSTGDFVFETPVCFILPEEDTTVRVDVLESGATTVSVRWGRVTLRDNTGFSTVISEGHRVWVDPGLLPSDPVAFDRSAEDEFDVWNRERSELLATGGQTLPKAVEVAAPTLGVRDLGNYGDWVYVDNRPYWRPTAVVDYVPYRHGYWSTVPAIGNVWVGNYPFSYVTSHYGRWQSHSSYGWIWSYDPVWSPAWAATVRYGDYFVWAPVDYYYRPVYATQTAFFTMGGIRFDAFSTSYVSVGHVNLGPSYIYGCSSNLTNAFYTGRHDVHIWNINYNRPNQVRVPYQQSLTEVRVYNPRRSIRGTSSFGSQTVLAQDRARSLESTFNRSQFSPGLRSASGSGLVRGSSAAGNRTTLAADSRQATVRNVRVSQDVPSYARASSSAPIRAGQESISRMVPRSRDISTAEGVGTPGGGIRSLVRTESGSSASGARTIRGSGTSGESRITELRSTPDRSAPGSSVRPTSSDSATTRTSVPSTAASRTSIPDRGTASSMSRTTTQRYPDATGTRTPLRVTRPSVSSTPGSASSPVESRQTPERTAPPAISAPSRVLSNSSSQRTESRSTGSSSFPSVSNSQTRTIQRPTISQPSPAPSVSRSTPSYTPRSAPSYSPPSQPRVSVSPPSRSITRSVPEPRQTAPSVSSPPRISAPAPQSPPSRSFSSPPSRSIERPSVSVPNSSISSGSSSRGSSSSSSIRSIERPQSSGSSRGRR